MEALCENRAGQYAHWGATIQDILDTGLALQLREALDEIEQVLRELLSTACGLASSYRDQTMAGRSQGQHALPITFGYKVAVWIAEMGRHLDRLKEMKPRVVMGQFGGAVGTLAALGQKGEAVQEALMVELDLPCPLVAWHTARDGIAELACVLGMITSTLGKIAHEIYLLQATEIAELEEPFATGKVGSSTMPHKRNPSICGTVVALARSVRTIPALAIEGMMADHERDYTMMQAEREFVARLCCQTHAALTQMAGVLGALNVRGENMERNLLALKGLMMSELIMMALGEAVGRQEAHDIVYELCMHAYETGSSICDVLLAHPLITAHLNENDIDHLLAPHTYTGAASSIVDRVVADASGRL